MSEAQEKAQQALLAAAKKASGNRVGEITVLIKQLAQACGKESAYLVMGHPGEIREWVRRGGLLMMPGRYGFYYRVGGMSSTFDLPVAGEVEALPANRLGS